jgi:DNA polymerase-1
MKQFVVLIDFSHLYHVCRQRALEADPEKYEFIDSLLYHFEGKLRTLKKHLNDLNIVGFDSVFVEDRIPARKLGLLPSYKGTRENRSDEKSALKTALIGKGYKSRFCYSEDNEADDVLATLVRMTLDAGVESIVVTGDKDLWQTIQPGVRVYNPIKQEMVTDADIEKAFKCRPIHIALYKSLYGDYGDCVPNVMPRTKKDMLPLILSTDGLLESLKASVEGDGKFYMKPACYKKWLDAQDEIQRNYELVKLDDQCKLVWE